VLGTEPHSLHWTILELEDDSDDKDDEAMLLMDG